MTPAPSARIHPSKATAERVPGRSPFDDVTTSVVAALAFAVGAGVWVIAGAGLPGGRWLAVHLFTLGVLSNVILAFTRHFTDTLTRVPAHGNGGRRVLAFNLGAVAVMMGMAWTWPIVVATGATIATGAVVANYRCLRRARRAALGARFAWIVRCYERAHGAFVHGAILGGLMGAGAVTGSWYGAARVAHLHVNLLGWAGVTLLATLVFFGPTMARTRIEPGADDRAARMIRLAAYCVTVATLALVATGLGGGAGEASRILAGLALAGFAWAATSTCRAVGRAVSTARAGTPRAAVAAVCWWLPVLAWSDVLVVGTGSWRHLDALGLGLLLGVFVQAVLATLTYLAPMLVADRNDGRARLQSALDRYGRIRSTTFNLGVAVVVVMAAAGTSAGGAGGVAARVGWTAVLVALAYPAVTTVVAR